MKLRGLAVGILFTGILFAPAFAQNATEPKARGERRGAGRGDAGGGMRGSAMMVDQQVERLNKELTLTKEQQDKIRKLITDQHEEMRAQMTKTMTENRDKMRELGKQIEDARTAGDKEKVKTLETQRRELMGESKVEASRAKLMTDIAGVLTDEQKPKFEKIKGDVFSFKPSLEEHPEMLARAVESLNLPKEKADKIKGIIDEWKTKNGASKEKDPKVAKEAAAEVYKKVMAELTTEQQAKVKEWRPMGGPMGGMRGERGAGGGEGRRHRGEDGKPAGEAKPKE
jgi:Spy/CpxP family protein refolding chaperone